ncbi:MAG TPA: LD-carboxypeptidase [Polyangiales bacterium]
MSVVSLRSPPALSPGSLVHVVAPSSPFPRERFDKGLALLEARYRTKSSAALFARDGFLAGDDQARLAALEAALDDTDAGAVIAARGGYGATRLLPHLRVEDVRRADTWLVGFSDVTALHALWARAGQCSIHGPMLTSLWEAEPATQAAWFELLEGCRPRALTGLKPLRAGRCAGRLLGGNLTVLAALSGTPYMPDLTDAVLLLEDVTERPYRIDRTLTMLLQSGALTGLRGVVLGQFSQCDPGPDGVSALAVLEERLGTLRIPLVADAPIGHVPDNQPVLLGARVELDATAGTLSWE